MCRAITSFYTYSDSNTVLDISHLHVTELTPDDLLPYDVCVNARLRSCNSALFKIRYI